MCQKRNKFKVVFREGVVVKYISTIKKKPRTSFGTIGIHQTPPIPGSRI
jgi:hypothetical protein